MNTIKQAREVSKEMRSIFISESVSAVQARKWADTIDALIAENTGKPIERKPLSTDEIQFVAQTVDKDWYADDVYDEWHVRFARAIEAAHGIKEQA